MSESTTETQTTTQNQSEINSQAPPPEASLSTTSPTTEYQASDLDLGIISDKNYKTKGNKIPVASKKDRDRQKWLKDFVWNNNDIKAYTSIGIDPPEHLGQTRKTIPIYCRY